MRDLVGKMSKIGKKPIKLPENITAVVESSMINLSSGNKAKSLEIPSLISVNVSDGLIRVTRKNDEKEAKSLHGLMARLIQNAITGISTGYEKKLAFTGTGYRASVVGNELLLIMGYSHDVKLAIPEGLEVVVVKNSINIKGQEKENVGHFAAVVRNVRPPEPYKGKGIRYSDEIIKRKAGKAAGK